MRKKEKIPVIRETLRFMFGLVRREKPALFALYLGRIIITFCYSMLDVIMPKFVIDEVAAILGGGDAELHLKNAAFYVIVFVGLKTLFSNFLSNLISQVISVIDEWFKEYVDIQLNNHAMAMDFEHTENPEALDALQKAKEGMSWYSGGVCGVLNAFTEIIHQAAILCGVSVLIFLTCPWLFPIQLVSLILITIFNAKNNKLENEFFLRLAKFNRVFGYVLYNLADYRFGKDIRLYESADMMCEKGDAYADFQISEWMNRGRKQCKNSWVMDFVNALRDGLSYFYIGYLALTKAITVGDFTMCISGSGTFYWSLHNIVTGIQEVSKKCAYAHRYLEFLKYPAAMTKGDKPVQKGEHTVEFVNVGFRYPRSEKYVLKNVNITIRSGEHLSIVGLNGAGKTTFIKLLCRLYDVTEGEILIDGVNIREYSEEEYRKLFAVVFQDFQLFAFSLKENIVLTEEADDERICEILKQAGLYDDVQKLEHGTDTPLFKSYNDKGTELSGGQKQKTAISRALYRNAPIVILDEPTAALDPVAEYEIYRQFNTLVGGKTAIYISHRLSSCKFCDRIAVFADDTIKEYGTHDELVQKSGGIYAEMFAAQAQYYTEAQPV